MGTAHHQVQFCFVFDPMLVSLWPLGASSLQLVCYYYKITQVSYLETDLVICGTYIHKKTYLYCNMNTSIFC